MYLFIVYLNRRFWWLSINFNRYVMLLFQFILFSDGIKTHKTKEKRKREYWYILNGIFWAMKSNRYV